MENPPGGKRRLESAYIIPAVIRRNIPIPS